jgi:hypothetical protein
LPTIKIMEKKIPTAEHKIIIHFAKVLIRLLVILFYIIVFLGVNYAFYAHTVRKESPKTFVRYNADNMPAFFPVLITSMEDNKTPAAQLKEIYVSEDLDEQTKLHQTLAKGELKIDAYDNGYYLVESIADARKKITLDMWVGGGDRLERYVYEVHGNRVYPQSFQLMRYHGWSYPGIPPAVLALIISILVCEKSYRLITIKMAARKLKLTP